MVDTSITRSAHAPPKFSPLTIDGTAKLLVAMQVGGFPGLNPKTDYDNCEMLALRRGQPDGQPRPQHGHVQSRRPIRAMARRGEVWTIDPLFTETAKFSTRHIQPYPGKDYAILAWLAREIIDGGPDESGAAGARRWQSCAPRWMASTSPPPPRSPACPSRTSPTCSLPSAARATSSSKPAPA